MITRYRLEATHCLSAEEVRLDLDAAEFPLLRDGLFIPGTFDAFEEYLATKGITMPDDPGDALHVLLENTLRGVDGIFRIVAEERIVPMGDDPEFYEGRRVVRLESKEETKVTHEQWVGLVDESNAFVGPFEHEDDLSAWAKNAEPTEIEIVRYGILRDPDEYRASLEPDSKIMDRDECEDVQALGAGGASWMVHVHEFTMPDGTAWNWLDDMDRASQVDMCKEILMDSRNLPEVVADEWSKKLGEAMAQHDASC